MNGTRWFGLVAGALLTAGCGGGDRSAATAQAKQDCIAAYGQTANVDADRLCACVAEKASAARAEGRGRELFGSKEPEPEEVQAVDQCLGQAAGSASK